jgi:hypothetical protein
MKITAYLIGFLLAAFGFVASAQAEVQVSFTHPERYTDAEIRRNSSDPSGLKPMLTGVEAHLKALGDHYLPADDLLKIDVLDIDLAGRYEPGRPFAYDVRVMRETEWPKIKLRYTLQNKTGVVLAQGEETVRDQNYLHQVNTYRAPDDLRYEKAMLDDWFQRRLVSRAGAQSVSTQPGS